VSRDSELAAVARRFPAWECWKGVSGLWYARLRGHPRDEPVTGESPEDLGDSIDRAERLSEE
jgi:hypothetical protein